MPVTPFHGGVGLAVKGGLGRRFSFTIFTATQVAIDLESGYYLVAGGWPLHRLFHTFVGATALCLVVALAARPLCEFLLRLCQRHLPTIDSKWLDLNPNISISTALLSGAIGIVAHVIPDAIMHADMRPFAPFSNSNPLLRLVDLTTLHAILVLAGVAGCARIIMLRRSVGVSTDAEQRHQADRR